MMPEAGPLARDIIELTWVLTGLGVLAFLLFAAAAVAALRRRPVEGRDQQSTGPRSTRSTSELSSSGSRWLIIGGGVVLPTAIIAIVFAWTLETMLDSPTIGADDALAIEVRGHRWWWEFHYPDAAVTTENELHIPIDRNVELLITSEDVVHSFWVPAVNGKMDALPDRVNQLVVRADTPGTYTGGCAEFCGLNHATMSITLIAHEDDDFRRWLAGEETSSSPTSNGARRAGADR